MNKLFSKAVGRLNRQSSKDGVGQSSRRDGPLRTDDKDDGYGFLCSTDLEKTSNGDFSIAVLPSKTPLESHSCVNVGQNSTFVGIYDGHSGGQAASRTNDFFFKYLLRTSKDHGSTVSDDIIKEVFSAAERDFIEHVRLSFPFKPDIIFDGCGCLVAIIWKEMLYVATLGDSKALLVSYAPRADSIVFLQSPPEDQNSTPPRVCRCIGDAHLKYPLDFNPNNHMTPFAQDEPRIKKMALVPDDRFVILASHGLWQLISEKNAANMVYNNPRAGIARRLIESALVNLGNKKLEGDLTVIVVFFENDKPKVGLSVRGCAEHIQEIVASLLFLLVLVSSGIFCEVETLTALISELLVEFEK